MSITALACLATILSGLFVLIVRAGIFFLRDIETYAGVLFAVCFGVFVGPGSVIVWIHLIRQGSTFADAVSGTILAGATLAILLLFHRLSRKDRAWRDTLPLHD